MAIFHCYVSSPEGTPTFFFTLFPAKHRYVRRIIKIPSPGRLKTPPERFFRQQSGRSRSKSKERTKRIKRRLRRGSTNLGRPWCSYGPWRIHGAAIYGAPWMPSIYPSHVSIYTSTMDPSWVVVFLAQARWFNTQCFFRPKPPGMLSPYIHLKWHRQCLHANMPSVGTSCLSFRPPGYCTPSISQGHPYRRL